jgi:hypothetical protein
MAALDAAMIPVAVEEPTSHIAIEESRRSIARVFLSSKRHRYGNASLIFINKIKTPIVDSNPVNTPANKIPPELKAPMNAIAVIDKTTFSSNVKFITDPLVVFYIRSYTEGFIKIIIVR